MLEAIEKRVTVIQVGQNQCMDKYQQLGLRDNGPEFGNFPLMEIKHMLL